MYRPPGRAVRYSRGTVSVLWFSTSGRASSTVAQRASSPWKSGISTSTRHAGRRALIAAIVCAKCAGAEVGQIVAIDRRDDDVGELHGVDRAGEVLGLVRIERFGAPCVTLQ